jgi:DNA-binding winged helix-turn-helix (wHTH) protein
LRYLFENYTLDTEKRELHCGADAVSITPQAFDLLDYLIRNRERVVSKDDLIIAVWNGRIVSDAALTTRLNAVRNAIGDSGEEQRLVKTLPRKGPQASRLSLRCLAAARTPFKRRRHDFRSSCCLLLTSAAIPSKTTSLME